MKVYLAGGLRTDWQDGAIDERWECLDPRTLNTGALSLGEVCRTELAWIDECDVLFAYLEKDNPSGLGMSAEMGYARARGKYIIFVDERGDRYTAWLLELADLTTTSFDGGLLLLSAQL